MSSLSMAGAIFGGFAMVLTIMLPARAIFGLHDLITEADHWAKTAGRDTTRNVPTAREDQQRYCISDDDVLLLDNLVWAQFASRAYAEAIDTARQSLREADFAGTRLCLVLCLVGAGDLPGAAMELQHLRQPRRQCRVRTNHSKTDEGPPRAGDRSLRHRHLLVASTKEFESTGDVEIEFDQAGELVIGPDIRFGLEQEPDLVCGEIGVEPAPLPPVVGEGEAHQLTLAVGVIQTEAHLHPAVRLGRGRAVQHRLGADRGPLRKVGGVGQRQPGLDEAGGIEGLEIARAAEVGADHPAEIDAVLTVEVDDGDLHRPQHALVDDHLFFLRRRRLCRNH